MTTYSAEGIDNAEGKQKIIVELYDKFFKTAFPQMVEQLGIVYTPIEVVDFIINSVNDVLKKEFYRSVTDENVHILDPFTGTGTFITRLLHSGLIEKKDLLRKYTSEIHANEIVLLAYYIAAINVENAFHDIAGDDSFTPFDGICLTDTFQLGETDDSKKLFSEMFPQNSARVVEQKNAPVQVIIGNPPYSVGQKSANDNAQNQSYDKLDSRIADTYASRTMATNKNSLYDSYIKAFRWSTDRLDPANGGIICYVSNGSWLDGNAQSGFRKVLEEEFSSIYVFNLRGNQRTSGELSRKEGGKIFGSGSRTPIAITLLVKKPYVKHPKANIYYHDIGDYLKREEKLAKLVDYSSIQNSRIKLEIIHPNESGDWINQRNTIYESMISIGDKKESSALCIFNPTYTNGLKTNRDAWVWNFSIRTLSTNVSNSIRFFNSESNRFANRRNKKKIVEEFIDSDATQISWSRAFRHDIENKKKYKFQEQLLTIGMYRPFVKTHLYYSRELINDMALMKKIFPKSTINNRVICVSGVGVTKEFSAIITDLIPDLELIGKSQCFPLHYFEVGNHSAPTFFQGSGQNQKNGVSNFILKRAHAQYGKTIGKEDIFYYVYGFLHSPEYRKVFSNDLKKMLPRLTLVDDVRDFWKFSKAGRRLAELHIEYETVLPFKGVKVTGVSGKFFEVTKMRFPKKNEKQTIIYNSKISITNIPEKAYQYVVNGKSAIEWIMERYQVTTHKASGIKNDPNDWAKEVGNPRFILDLLLSIINVSVQTVDIIEGLPKLNFEEK